MLNTNSPEINACSQELVALPIHPNISKEFDDIAYGCVDNVDQNGISGWYLHKSNKSPLLKVSSGGIVIGYCRPTLERPDISAIIGRQADCGFFFKWFDLIDSQALQLLVRNSEPFSGLQVSCVETERKLHHLMEQDVFLAKLRDWLMPHLSAHVLAIKHGKSRGPVTADRGDITPIPAPCCHLDVDVINGQKLAGQVVWSAGIADALAPVQLSFYSGSDLLDTITLSPRRVNSMESVSRTFSWPVPSLLLDGQERPLEVRASAPGRSTTSRSLTFGTGHFDFELKYVGAGRLEGFALERVIKSDTATVQLRVDANRIYEVAVQRGPAYGRDQGKFSFVLPREYLDGAPHSVELMAGGRQLCLIQVVHALKGHIDTLNDYQLAGWLYDSSSDRPLELIVRIDGIELPVIVADLPRNDVGRACGFNCDLSQATEGKAAFEITIELKHAGLATLDTPKFYYRTDGLIETIRRLASSTEHGAHNKLDQTAVAKYLGPRLIRMLRQEVGQSVILSSHSPAISTTVKVVVPVYDGVDETLRCLLALFKSKEENKIPFDVVLIDDRGPNPAMGSILKKVAMRPDVTLIVNEHNMGFVRSVNKALGLMSGYDIVLLNADAVVNGNWLDRIRETAYADPTVASVTPFSNNATICSYPDPELENSMPSDLSLSEIDQLCATVNKGVAVEIPSGVGFCMYMKAEAIAEIGLLDAEKFGMGYGEENDWCVRARDQGWKHVHACDTFVEHIGGVSFGKDKKNNLVEKNLVILGQAYPEYTPIIMDFIKSDPARVYRNRITIQRMRHLLTSFAERHLYVSHSFGGGIDVFCKSQARKLEGMNIATVMLESVGDKVMRLYYGELTAEYRTKEDMDELQTALNTLSLARIHMNSDIGHSTAIWDLPQILQLPLDVTVHDYTAVCPRVNFITRAGSYCGEPTDPRKCDRCISKDGAYAYLTPRFKSLNSSISDWRKFYESKLTAAENVYAPDSDVAERFNVYFPSLEVEVRPHDVAGIIPEILPPSVQTGDVMRIAVIGAIGPHKGFDLLHACIAHANQQDLPLQFVIIGYTCDDERLKQYKNVVITGKFDQEMLEDILIQQDCHAALFLSPWPETYSYTLTEALLSGLWPVVLPVGAQASRVRAMEIGTVLPQNAHASDVNKALLSLGFQ